MRHCITALLTIVVAACVSPSTASAKDLRPTWAVFVATDYEIKYEVIVEHYNGTTSSRGIFDERWEAEIEVIYAENHDPYNGAPVSAAVADAWIVEVEVACEWRRYGTYPSEFGAQLVTLVLNESGLDAYYTRGWLVPAENLRLQQRK